MRDLSALKPRVKRMAEAFLAKCSAAKIPVLITCTLRTVVEQNELYSLGRTKPGRIVTQAKGGYSLHNYGVAIDFVPLIGGKPCWNNLNLFFTCGQIGRSVGFEWGGDWPNFPDRPHLQYTAGYKIQNFLKNKIDIKRFT